MSDETTLLPCPFCGGKARLTVWTPTATSVSCIMCGAHFNTYTEAEAIEAWNTREPIEYDGWFYLPKPKEAIVQYLDPQVVPIAGGYKVQQPVELMDSAIRSWSDELGKRVMERICEAWGERAESSSRKSGATTRRIYNKEREE